MSRTVKGLILGALLASFSIAAEAGGYQLSAGADYTRGDYGTSVTSEMWSLPLSLAYLGERFAWSLSVPYLIVTAPEGFVFSGGTGLQLQQKKYMGAGEQDMGKFGPAMGAATGSPSTRTVTGVGDVTAALSASLTEEGELRPWLALTGKLKIATADADRGLGTGEHDEALQLEWAKGFVNGYFGHKWLGDTPTTDFRDVRYAALGVTYVSDQGAQVGLEMYGEEAALSGSEDLRELTLYGSYPLHGDLALRGYVLWGFSDGSADTGAGVALQYAL